MPCKLKRYPEYGVTFFLFSGALGEDELARVIETLDRRDCSHWLSYCAPTVTLEAISVGVIPELKRRIAEKQAEIFGELRLPNAIVHTSKGGEAFSQFWRHYTLAGRVHPLTPAVLPNLKAACEWLGLPGDARARFEEEVALQNTTRPGEGQGRRAPNPGASVR